MSYILDALKKSEQERKQGEVPGLNSFQHESKPSKSTDRMLVYMLIGTLFFILLTLGIWAIFSQSPTPPVESAKAVISAVPPIPDDQPGQSGGGDDAIEKAGETAELKQPASLVSTESPVPEQSVPAPDTPAETADIAPVDELLVEAEPDSGDNQTVFDDEQESSTPVKAKLITYANLPEDVRNDLPELVISVHYFAENPSSRMASINGRIMRQGQRVAEGLVLEEIIREGVILSFRKYRFSLAVFKR